MLEKITQKLSPYKIHILASIMLGMNPIAIKVAVREFDPIYLVGLHYLAVGLMVGYFYRRDLDRLSKGGIKAVLFSTLLTIGWSVTHYVGIQRTTALKAGIIILVTPLVLYLFSITLLKERLIKKAMFGSFVGLIGSLVIIGAPIFTVGEFSSGDVLLLTGAVILAGQLAMSKYMYKFCNFAQIISYRQTMAGLAIMIYAVATERTVSPADVSFTALSALIFTIIPGGVIALLLFYSSLKKLKAEETAPVFYLHPMTTIVLSAFLLGEFLSYSDYIGASLIIFGVALAHPHHHYVLHRLHLPRERKLNKLFNYVRGMLASFIRF